MDQTNLYQRAHSRRSFVIIMFFIVFLLVIVDLALYAGFNAIAVKISAVAQDDAGLKELVGWAGTFQDKINIYFIPAAAGIFILSGFLLWFFLRLSFIKAVKKSGNRRTKEQAGAVGEKSVGQPADQIDKKVKMDNEKRMFLYLFSLLQREGRLMDFFSEDLNLYEDAQIGAAVRSIHGNCKRVIDKNLAPAAVINKDEGEDVTIDEGFDPGSINLTGNVIGKPPFKGVLRHRGWKSGNMEMPVLSGNRNPNIIAPAEVEIL